MTDTATIETLTAEVRTLVVGSRQVTLSVARQLDTVPLAELEVFGRVRLNNVEGHHVIGRAQDGSLALARYIEQDQVHCVHIRDSLSHKPDVCRSYFRRSSSAELTLGTSTFQIAISATNPCRKQIEYGHCNGCEEWDDNGTENEIRWLIDAQFEYDAPRVALNNAAEASPLIVLAGLR